MRQDALQKKIADENTQAFNSYKYAEKIDCEALYDSVYRITSAAVHTTPRAIEKYTDDDSVGNILSIKDYPLEGDIPWRVYDFASYLIRVLSGLKEVFGCLDEAEILDMVTRLNETMKDSSHSP